MQVVIPCHWSLLDCGRRATAVPVPDFICKFNGPNNWVTRTDFSCTEGNLTVLQSHSENGGPGEPNALPLLQVAEQEAAGNGSGAFAQLRPVFDIIGLDMRGTGSSVPIRCDHNAFNSIICPMVTDETSYNDMITRNRAFGESCVNMTGPLIYHMGTDQAVRDIELLRQALGHDKLNYLGFSYGAQFGSEYAEVFPDKVGRMVLDGMADRHFSDEMYLATAAVGLESTVNDFFRWCNTTAECALYGRDQAAIFDAVVAAAESGTLHAQNCSGGPCNHGGTAKAWEVVQMTLAELHDYDDKKESQNWYIYAEGLKAAFDNGNATYFVPAQVNSDNSTVASIYSQWAIVCSDQSRRHLTFEDFRNMYTVTSVLAPHTLGYGNVQEDLSICAGWPIEASNPPHDLDPKRMSKLPPIMLVNAFYDPATVLPWALGMRAQIPTGFSVYRNGGGHTSWSHDGDTTRAINAFLIHGEIPPDGTIYQT